MIISLLALTMPVTVSRSGARMDVVGNLAEAIELSRATLVLFLWGTQIVHRLKTASQNT